MSENIVSKSNDFGTVISIIESSKGRALKAINAELIHMYWNVGEYLSKLCAKSSFGDKVIRRSLHIFLRQLRHLRALIVVGYTG